MNLNLLKKYLPLNPVVLDIGAHQGGFFYDMKNLFPDAKIISIEALPDNFLLLKQVNPYSYQGAISNDVKKVTFFLPNEENISTTGASYYKEKTSYYDDPRVVELETVTLRSFLKINDLPEKYDLVKLDTQGSELDILSDFDCIDTNLILLELPLVEYNEGAPSISDYLDFMSKHFFFPVELIELHRDSSNVLLQIDLLFQNIKTLKNSAFLKKA
jgi:FkbM family methyltransferase